MDSKKKEILEAEDLVGTYLKGDRYADDERYKKSVDAIYKKLKPIWINECKDAVWLLQDSYVHEVAEILYLDDQLGGKLDTTTLSEGRQNLLAWKQVQSAIERYKAVNYSLVDTESIKAILSSIIKNQQARDSDRLKAIEMYNNLYSSDQIEGITFWNNISKPPKTK